MPHDVDSLERLRVLYPPAKERSLRKQLAALDAHCLRFVSLSPFVVLSSVGASGTLDASPRGGAPGFVKAPDAGTLLLPDAIGNNRLDTLENVIETGRIGMLFVIPGVDETLRVNGDARLSTDPALIARFDDARHAPRLVLAVTVREAYLHCAKALMRSRLWAPDARVDRASLPTMGRMLKDQTGDDGPEETQAQMLARYSADL
jgi:PPOX class probable FMN-dependent enzyme